MGRFTPRGNRGYFFPLRGFTRQAIWRKFAGGEDRNTGQMQAIKEHPSPNFGQRRDGAQPDLVVLHYTGMESCDAALARLCDPEPEVSAHYLIAEDGEILRLVDEANRAWHAGQAQWGGVKDVNSRSIGIELANPGHELGYPPFSRLLALLVHAEERQAAQAHAERLGAELRKRLEGGGAVLGS